MSQAEAATKPIVQMNREEFRAFLKSRMAINGPPPGYQPPKAPRREPSSNEAAPPPEPRSNGTPVNLPRASARPDPAASPGDALHRGPEDHAAATPDLSVTLAEVLDDHRSLRFYESIARRLHRGDLCRARSRESVSRMLLAKARELAARRAPHGSIANPAAVFAAWVKKL